MEYFSKKKRYSDITVIASITSLFKKESYKEQAFKTMNNHVGNGFCYIGKKLINVYEKFLCNRVERKQSLKKILYLYKNI